MCPRAGMGLDVVVEDPVSTGGVLNDAVSKGKEQFVYSIMIIQVIQYIWVLGTQLANEFEDLSNYFKVSNKK